MIYTYECSALHHSELDFPFAKAPREIDECPYIPDNPSAGDYPLDIKSCGLPAVLVITGGGGFIVNKEMLPPSKRYRGFRGGD